MGSFCSRQKPLCVADAEENAKAAEIERRIAQETKAEQHIHKLLLLGAGESGKSTIFKQIKLLFQTVFDEAELRSYTSVTHANVYQTIKEIGEKLSDIGSRWDHLYLTSEMAKEIETLWNDAAVQETYYRGDILQIPVCAQYFMENLERFSDVNYVPTKEDVLYARVRTSGVVEIQFRKIANLVLYDGAKELAQNDIDSSKYVVYLYPLIIRWDHPYLTSEVAKEIETLWNDAAIQLFLRPSGKELLKHRFIKNAGKSSGLTERIRECPKFHMREGMETLRNDNNFVDDGASTVRVTKDSRDEISKSRAEENILEQRHTLGATPKLSRIL
ncbi:hypothetical protein J5N97_024575 [Dioscorea zingiberensis]|uniref:Guanine nucleotide-binding protein alpha subunit n=1 Tax=Dioscorea zingiberensis TaxID=325984 RepID=A0A9D5C769_9LILI|nr:hypothetical protein J5N97_024575 [Dioscorea zingiberensis]